jgi:hypothetical protein
MPGILDANYGVKDEQRERLIKRVVLIALIVLVVGGGLYYWFRNWRQERVVDNFLSLLKEKRYQEAYAMWGCTQDNPCKYWGPERFNEEWGPASPYADVAAIKIAHEDPCGNGVVFDIETPKAPPQGLFVNSETNTLSYALAARCPGRHLQIWEFLKSHFS